MELTNAKLIAQHFLFALLFFVVSSMILQDGMDLVKNMLWAAGYTVIIAVRDNLEPVRKRIFNLVMYGFMVVVMLTAMFILDNSNAKFLFELIAILYCTYRFYEVYETKT